jgi:hypothetical protein
VARAHKTPHGRNGNDGGDQDGGNRFALTRGAFAFRRAANDNRLSLKGWAERVIALALLIGLGALVAWKLAG